MSWADGDRLNSTNLNNTVPTWASTLGSVYNAVEAGADYTGVTAAQTIINGLITTASAAGGGVVYLPAGTYALDIAVHPNSSSVATALILKDKVTLRGAGLGATILKLNVVANAVPAGCIANWQLHIASTNTPYSGTNTDITVEDLTIDGNAVNQTFVAPNAAFGLFYGHVRGGWVNRVRVKNFYGTGSAPPTETMHFEANGSTDVHYTDCQAVSDTGIQTSTGFSANVSTGVEYTGCVTRGMANGMGFTNWTSALIRYANCHAYLNGVRGFNTERGERILYVNCQAGGSAASTTGGILTSQQSLGNDYGFVVQGSQKVGFVNCDASYNSSYGFWIKQDATASPTLVADSVTLDPVFFFYNDLGVVVDASATNITLPSTLRYGNNISSAFSLASGADAATMVRATDAPIETWQAINATSGVRLNVVGGAGDNAFRFQSDSVTMLSLSTLGNVTASGRVSGTQLVSSTTAGTSGTSSVMTVQGLFRVSVLSLTTNGCELGILSGNTVYRFYSVAAG